jgi:hypothetical protein
MKVRHLKGIFPAINHIPCVGRFKDGVEFHVEFTEDSKYTSDDQGDYIKCGGVSFNPILASRKNSIMLARRYDPDTGLNYCVAYWHSKDGTRGWSGEYAAEEVFWRITKSGIRFAFVDKKGTNEIETLTLMYSDLGIKPSKFYRTISSWAGGNTKPKNNFNYLLRRRKL